MLFFKFSGRKIKITVEKEVTDWELRSDFWSNPEKIAQDMKYTLENKFREEISKHVEMQVQSGLLDELAKKAIADLKLEEMYEIALKDKIKQLMFSGR